MHSSRELRSSLFAITVGGREPRLVDLFDGFGEHDRLGVVIRRPCGGVGASALITATITAFYEVRIEGNHVVEGYVDAVLDPEMRPARLRATNDWDRADAIEARLGEVAPEERRRVKQARKDLVEGDAPVETYRRIALDEALGLLAAKPAEPSRRAPAAAR